MSLALIELTKNTEDKKLKDFGLTLSLVLTIIASLLFRKYHPNFIYFYIAGCLVIIISILSPNLLKGIYKILMFIASIIGRINTALILSLIFYLIFAPVGIFCRIFKIDLLDEKIEKDSITYWKRKEEVDFDKSRYERLF